MKRSKIYKKIQNFIWKLEKSFYWYLPRELAHKIYYKRVIGKKLDLSNPKDLNEKIQWLIVNEYGENEASYADKYLARDYIKDIGYENILTKIYKVYDEPGDIDISKLPNKFVLKLTHGSGPNYYSICYDKKVFDSEKEISKLTKYFYKDFARQSLEYHYSFIKPRIICEEYINDLTGIHPIDYKIFCFHGKPECILVISDRGEVVNRNYYDTEWKYLDYAKDIYQSKERHPKPKNFEDMLKIAKEISKPFKFARIDFYNVDGKIYFGEITLTPAGGVNRTYKEEALLYLGSLLEL